jgi:hypothetical protein
VYSQETVAQVSHKNINKRIFENISKDHGKGQFGSIDVCMANGFFSAFFRIFSKIPWLTFL